MLCPQIDVTFQKWNSQKFCSRKHKVYFPPAIFRVNWCWKWAGTFNMGEVMPQLCLSHGHPPWSMTRLNCRHPWLSRGSLRCHPCQHLRSVPCLNHTFHRYYPWFIPCLNPASHKYHPLNALGLMVACQTKILIVNHCACAEVSECVDCCPCCKQDFVRSLYPCQVTQF